MTYKLITEPDSHLDGGAEPCFYERTVQKIADAAYAAGLAEGCRWQPIETAPKETEVFIGAFIDGNFKFGRSELFYEQANELEGETFSGWVWAIDDCSDSVAEDPEYWMPLPAAPEPVTYHLRQYGDVSETEMQEYVATGNVGKEPSHD